jgi:hypothetical protein
VTIFNHEVSIKKAISIAGLVIILAGIPLGMYLIKQQQVLKSRADLSGTRVEIVDAAGNAISETNGLRVKLKLTYVPPSSSSSVTPSPLEPSESGEPSPLDSATPSPSASVSVSASPIDSDTDSPVESASPSDSGTDDTLGVSTEAPSGLSGFIGGIFNWIGNLFSGNKISLAGEVSANTGDVCYSDAYCSPDEKCIIDLSVSYGGTCQPAPITSTAPVSSTCHGNGESLTPDNFVAGGNCCQGLVPGTGSTAGLCVPAPTTITNGHYPVNFQLLKTGAFNWDGSFAGLQVHVYGPCDDALTTSGCLYNLNRLSATDAISSLNSKSCEIPAGFFSNTEAIATCTKKVVSATENGSADFGIVEKTGNYIFWVDPMPQGTAVAKVLTGTNPVTKRPYDVTNNVGPADKPYAVAELGSTGFTTSPSMAIMRSGVSASCPAATGTPLGGIYPTHFKVANSKGELAYAEEQNFLDKISSQVQPDVYAADELHCAYYQQQQGNFCVDKPTNTTPACHGNGQLCGSGGVGTCCSGLTCNKASVGATTGICGLPPAPATQAPAIKYGCNAYGQCVPVQYGSFTSSTCGGSCRPPTNTNTNTNTGSGSTVPPTGTTAPAPSSCEQVFDKNGKIIDWTLTSGAGDKSVWVQFKVAGVWGAPIESPKVKLTAGGASASTTASPSASTSTGTGNSNAKFDLNSDGKVNAVDASIFKNFWRTNAHNTAIDFNKDGVINSFDYSQLKSHLLL